MVATTAPRIRGATLDDVEGALALWRLLQDEHEAVEPRIRRSADAERRWRTDFGMWVASRAHGVFVAAAGGRVVGLVTAHPYWPAPVYEEQLEVYVNELVVHPDWRGRGIGRDLIDVVRAWAAETGAGQVRAGVLTANPDAVAFWQRIGGEPFYVTVTLPAEDDEAS
jgi:GNAT superfamily N-acetyltransferase